MTEESPYTPPERYSTGEKYLTAPDPEETGWPKGVPYIIGNEACERFSYYGMRAILQIHMTALFAAQIIGEKTAEALNVAELHAQ